MKILAAIGRFLYDLLIGDSWRLTLAVALVLLVGVAAAELNTVPPTVLAIGMAAVATVTASLTVVIEARKAYGKR